MNQHIQNQKIKELYSDIAEIYDKDFSGKADYKAPKILAEIFEKNKIREGSVLDLGCGTGEISKILNGNFKYSGIDLSQSMLDIAKSRGYQVFRGDILDIISKFKNKSFDHIIALSSLYFTKDFDKIIEQVERVSRKTYFFTLEQFSDDTKDVMKKRGIEILNHSLSLIENPTELIKNMHLWTRPNTEDKIYGDVVFKNLN